jgi:predicted ATPase/Tfp pilus assembly protein PilF
MPIFFFSDIEKSTEKWEKHADVMGRFLIRHDSILTETIAEYGGRVIKHTGDGFFAVFESGDPLSCAIEIQKRLSREDWSRIGDLRVRIAINTGVAEQRGDDYFGPAINRTARLLVAASGGQILLTAAAKAHCPVPESAILIDLGVHFLPDLGEPLNIYQLDHPELPIRKFTGLRTLSNRPHNLPAQPTEFIGREHEIEEISACLRDPNRRLINIVGPGGIGKTRLALQTGALNFEKFQNGVFFIPLENLTYGSIQFLVFAVADAINFTFYSREDPKLQLINYLREKEMLLIMDNFEHLVAEAGLLSDIIQQAPRVKLLVTSRERLRLKGEYVREIEGLDYPEREDDPNFDQYGAVRLFIQSGRSVQPDLVLNADDRRALLRLFRLVDGVPLCIELAASWMRSVTCPEIVQELEKNMDFLDSTVQDMPKRHRNLRAVFEYSWILLTEREKVVFRKLSAFGAAFTREAAEKISGIGLTDIAAMVDKSLLRRRSDGRYEMFPLLRQYAEEKLTHEPVDDKTMRDRHAAYYSTLFQSLLDQYYQGREDVFLKSVDEDVENGRQAFLYAFEHEHFTEAESLISALQSFYEMKGWFLEAERLLSATEEKLTARHGTEPGPGPLRNFLVLILRLKGVVLRCLTQYDRARSGLEKAQRLLAGKESDEAMTVLSELGTIAYRTGDFDGARGMFREAMKYWEQFGAQRKVAHMLNSLGNIEFETQQFEAAKEWYEKSLKIMREIGYNRGVATSLNNLGNIYFSVDKLTEAEECHRQSIEIRRAINDRHGLSSSYNNLGVVFNNQGKPEAAIEQYLLALTLKREMGDLWGVCNTLLNIGSIYASLEKGPEARDRFREALQILSRIKAQPLQIQAVNRCAEFFMWQGKKELALKLYAYIINFPGVGEKRRSDIRDRIAGFADSEIKSAEQRAAGMTVDAVMQEINQNL